MDLKKHDLNLTVNYTKENKNCQLLDPVVKLIKKKQIQYTRINQDDTKDVIEAKGESPAFTKNTSKHVR